MEMASGASHGAGGNAAARTTNMLPSLFGDHGVNSVGNALATGKDLDGLMAMNDSALSQQIEFILQDAPMDQDDDDCSAEGITANSVNVNLENPPTTSLTSASDYNHVDDGTLITTSTHMATDHLLNGRRIIIQSTEAIGLANHEDVDDEEDPDPELNDENLQDIEEEAQAAEAEEEPPLLQTQVKIEQTEIEDQHHQHQHHHHNGSMKFINANALTHHGQLTGQTSQLVLPAGSIVSTTTRALTVPVSEALAQLQRRPVYISNAVAGMTGATFVRMPAVISRSPMTVLNVVQQNVPGGAPTTQLILQAAPVSTSATPVVVTASTATIPAAPPVPAAEVMANAASNTVTVVPASSSAIHHTVASKNIAVSPVPALTSATASPSTSASTMTTVAASPINNNATHNSATTIVTTTANATIATTTSNNTNSNTNNTTTTTTNTTTTYQCTECVEKFESKELFDIHRSGHANNMKCAICNMVLKSLKNYEKHCLRCKPYECQICGRVVRFRPNFIKHMRVHTGQQSERHKYKCDVCHKEFMSFEYFKVHKKIHNENVNLTCEICGKVFSALASLRGHSKLHSGVKLHKCDVCGKGFGQRYNLKIHARTHTGDFPYECKICKKKLHTQSSLQTHMQTHQRDQTSQVTTTIKYENASSSSALSAGTTKAANITATRATIIKLEPQNTTDTGGVMNQSNNDGMEIDTDLNGCSPQLVSATTTSTTTTGGSINVNVNVRNNNGTTVLDDSNESSNVSHGICKPQHLQPQQQQQTQHQHQQQQPPSLLLTTPTRTIVIKNFMQNDQNVNVIAHQQHQQQQQQQQQHHQHQQQQTQVIQDVAGTSNSALQQQLLRKTPIIHSTCNSSNLTSIVQHQTGISPSLSPSSSSTSCSSSVVVSKTGAPLSLASAAMATSIIRSTRSHSTSHQSGRNNHRTQKRSSHRNHHRRHTAIMHDDDDDDDDDEDDDDDNDDDHNNNNNNDEDDDDENDVDDDGDVGNEDNDVDNNNANNLHTSNSRNFDDYDDDEKSSPSLATAAIIKVEPNLYSSGSGDNSNDMLIKEEVLFEDSANPHSPHSPPSSKYRISNFDSDLVDHHVDLNHSLPPYGNLFEPHSIPDSIPTQLYPDDDDDFRLDHSSLGALHNTSSSTTDGDFIKKEWVYGAGSSYVINGKFEDDSDALCDAANFIYN